MIFSRAVLFTLLCSVVLAYNPGAAQTEYNIDYESFLANVINGKKFHELMDAKAEDDLHEGQHFEHLPTTLEESITFLTSEVDDDGQVAVSTTFKPVLMRSKFTSEAPIWFPVNAGDFDHTRVRRDYLSDYTDPIQGLYNPYNTEDFSNFNAPGNRFQSYSDASGFDFNGNNHYVYPETVKCRYWCLGPHGEPYCCESTKDPISTRVGVKTGHCPTVRSVCPEAHGRRRSPRTCSSDFSCPADEKCCLDICIGRHVCKPPIGPRFY
ncbi:uncharacterized protein LOC108669002 [Hyalella azteca]|uniref:Uncharacterized protein LOC108669002 n=1 Tax=Hyalella azteca TaxID=294128 RepID=A0A8B7NE69_HYAAZ|nr:uncharacterized protein LOC108669002 [Hyalella azteca]